MSSSDPVDLAAGAVDCLPHGGLAQRLKVGRPLRVKLGVDPTAPDIHFGHAVVLEKLRRFQDDGHVAVLIIGDWTARVGDPSGRTTTRPVLSVEQITANASSYREQAFSILDPERTEIRYNGEWFAQMGLEGLFRLAGSATVNQLLHRNDFATRIADDKPISVLELLYPLMQAYDSVMVDADVELGGTDQLFNLMLGREIQEAFGRPPQIALTMPILPGLDGTQKMSKSLGNHVGLNEQPQEQFGRIMSLPDHAMADWYRLLAPTVSPASAPAAAKRQLARLLVDRCHGVGAGADAEAHFNRVVRDHSAPDDAPIVRVSPGLVHLPALLVDSLGISSRAQARRLIADRAVRLDDAPLDVIDIDAAELADRTLRAGKRRFARLQLEK